MCQHSPSLGPSSNPNPSRHNKQQCYLKFNSSYGTSLSKRKNPNLVERNARKRVLVQTTIRTGFRGFVVDNRLRQVFKDLVHDCSRLAIEANIPWNIHVIGLLDKGNFLPEMNQTYFGRLFSAVLRIGTTQKCHVDLQESLAAFKGSCPENCRPIERRAGMTRISEQLAMGWKANFGTMIAANLGRRLKSWFRLRMSSNTSLRFLALPQKIQSKTTSLLLHFATSSPAASVQELLHRYTSITIGTFNAEQVC